MLTRNGDNPMVWQTPTCCEKNHLQVELTIGFITDGLCLILLVLSREWGNDP